MHINFSEADENFIRHQIQNGSYINETELIRDAVRRLREENEKKKRFVESVILGDNQIENGETVLFTKELLENITQRAKLRMAKGEKPSPDVTP